MQLQSFLPILAAGAASAASLTQVLSQNNNTLSTLNSLLAKEPGIVSALGTAKNITILAPSNDAFTKLLATNKGAAAMATNTTAVATLLQYHVLTGMFMSTDFNSTAKFVPSLMAAMVGGGQKVELVKAGNSAVILSGFKQESTVSQADIMFDGGVVHVIDTVLTVPDLPSTTALDLGLTSLAGALTKANLVTAVDAASNITIFAPSNAAFQAIGSVVNAADAKTLASVLSYHVVGAKVAFSTDLAAMATAAGGEITLTSLQGPTLTVRMENGSLFVNSAKVIMGDIITKNGVIHVIDNVLNPSSTTVTPDATRATQTPVFADASSVASAPFTSGISPTVTLTAATVAAMNAGGLAAMPTAVLMGVLGGAAAVANL